MHQKIGSSATGRALLPKCGYSSPPNTCALMAAIQLAERARHALLALPGLRDAFGEAHLSQLGEEGRLEPARRA